MLPTSVIIGAQKAGTTFLKLSLAAHPDVDAPRGECPFFEDPHYDPSDLGPLEALFAGSSARVRIIKRPDYLARPECPARIHTVLPDARLVAVVRHPVERAVSAYFHFVARGLLPLRPLNPGMRAILDGARDDRFAAAQDVVEYGYYQRHLHRYVELFPRTQLTVFVYERLRHERAAVLAEAMDFLGLDPERLPPIKQAQANESMHALPRLANYRLRTRLRTTRDAERRNVYPRQPLSTPRRWGSAALRGLDGRILTKMERGKPELSAPIRAELLERYRDDTTALEAFLDTDLSAWKR